MTKTERENRIPAFASREEEADPLGRSSSKCWTQTTGTCSRRALSTRPAILATTASRSCAPATTPFCTSMTMSAVFGRFSSVVMSSPWPFRLIVPGHRPYRRAVEAGQFEGEHGEGVGSAGLELFQSGEVLDDQCTGAKQDVVNERLATLGAVWIERVDADEGDVPGHQLLGQRPIERGVGEVGAGAPVLVPAGPEDRPRASLDLRSRRPEIVERDEVVGPLTAHVDHDPTADEAIRRQVGERLAEAVVAGRVDVRAGVRPEM